MNCIQRRLAGFCTSDKLVVFQRLKSGDGREVQSTSAELDRLAAAAAETVCFSVILWLI